MQGRPEADVLIVGGGPAGSAAALTCAKAGLRVRLLERESFPRNRPGETLHPGVEPLFQQLGVWERVEARGFPRFEGNWVTWGEPRRFEAFGRDDSGPWLGFQAWRADLDALLLEGARDAGAEVVQPCRVTEARISEGRVVGANTSHGPMHAPFVVDATGGGGWLARELGLEVERHSPRLVARYGYVEGRQPGDTDGNPSIVADADGWTWTAPVSPDLTAWTRLHLTDRKRPPDGFPKGLRDLRAVGKSRGADVTWRCVRPAAGPGHFLAGDAASVLDPASSHGVLKALMTGMMAGDRIAKVFGGILSPQAAADTYSAWVADWFRHDVTALRELYRVFETCGEGWMTGE